MQIFVKTSIECIRNLFLRTFHCPHCTFFDSVNKRKYRHGLDMIDETHTTQYSLFEYLVYFFHVSLTDIEFIPFV